ncbi:putative adenosine/adenine deaminase [Rhizocola hellebori]|uniref:Putative adenosine/adenine deaminase n=2 Tax=Rhizocola hellebori TaxID=1392758 RepID=A0A8J3Q351_9ACTN|nr:putative adenosine/adenine deaminase [Rhizocola hellebori]
MRAATLEELSAEAGLPAPNPRGFTTFAEFQTMFQAVYDVTRIRPENLMRLVREIVDDAAADGVVWVQPHFDPNLYPSFGPAEHVLEMALAEGHAAAARHGIGFGLTLGAMRHLGPDWAVSMAHFAGRYVDAGVRALGLTGDEVAFPPEPFAEAFAIAREAGLTAAPHAGELSGPDSVRAAVEVLGATRIAHGVQAVHDPELLAMLAERKVTLDVCLTSNDLLGVAPLAQHPLPRLLEAGVGCSLGADDPTMFGVGLLDEYRLARTELGLSDHQLASLARTSIDTSDAPPALVAAATARIGEWLAVEDSRAR